MLGKGGAEGGGYNTNLLREHGVRKVVASNKSYLLLQEGDWYAQIDEESDNMADVSIRVFYAPQITYEVCNMQITVRYVHIPVSSVSPGRRYPSRLAKRVDWDSKRRMHDENNRVEAEHENTIYNGGLPFFRVWRGGGGV